MGTMDVAAEVGTVAASAAVVVVVVDEGKVVWSVFGEEAVVLLPKENVLRVGDCTVDGIGPLLLLLLLLVVVVVDAGEGEDTTGTIVAFVSWVTDAEGGTIAVDDENEEDLGEDTGTVVAREVTGAVANTNTNGELAPETFKNEFFNISFVSEYERDETSVSLIDNKPYPMATP
jgi:hypothetical protein